MEVMPHTDIDRAFDQALSTDILFWPQLPNLTGILLDLEERNLRFSMEKFIAEFEKTFAYMDGPEYFDISPEYSAVYYKFLRVDDRPAIRGQREWPISFGFNVLDQNKRPIIFDDTVRPFLLEFMEKRVNIQLERLKKLNKHVFMFVDEPGLQFVFSALSVYGDVVAHQDTETFFSINDCPRGVHLCGNPDWDFLLSLDLETLPMDVYTNGDIFISYVDSIRDFLDKSGVLVWGIVPTNIEPFEKEGLDSLEKKLVKLWEDLAKKGIDFEFVISHSLLSPATCCLVNLDREKTVEKAFVLTNRLSAKLREKYKKVLQS